MAQRPLPPMEVVLAELARRQKLAATELARQQVERERRDVGLHRDEIKARCKSLLGFIREAWPVVEPANPYVHGQHMEVICRHLEAVTAGKITRLVTNEPPSMMKSLTFGVFWPAWEWGPAGLPSLRYLTTSYKEDYVKRDARRMRDLVASDWYQSLWGDTVKLKRDGEASFENTATGYREGVPFRSLTGGKGNRVIIDDPHSTEKAESETERNTATRIFRESVQSRLIDAQRDAILIVMQRLHQSDVSGVAIKLGYEHLRLPMEYEADNPCYTSLGRADWRTEEGELLFPERFPADVVERDKGIMGSYATASQYQQRPSPREGGMFKAQWWNIIPAPPSGIIWCRGWDLAASVKTTSAFSAGAKVGVTPDGRTVIGDVNRLRGSPHDVERAIVNTASQDGDEVTISLPQDPGQAGKAQISYLVSKLAGRRVHFSPETGSKETRAAPLAAQAEAGNVSLVRGPWNDAFIEEAGLFPNGDFLDQVDAASRAYSQVARVGIGRPRITAL